MKWYMVTKITVREDSSYIFIAEMVFGYQDSNHVREDGSYVFLSRHLKTVSKLENYQI